MIPYYHVGTVEDGDAYSISGYVPCLINGERAELLLTFDNETPYGYIAGARADWSLNAYATREIDDPIVSYESV